MHLHVKKKNENPSLMVKKPMTINTLKLTFFWQSYLWLLQILIIENNLFEETHVRPYSIASREGNDEGKQQANACKQHWYVDGPARLGGSVEKCYLYFISVWHFKLKGRKIKRL